MQVRQERHFVNFDDLKKRVDAYVGKNYPEKKNFTEAYEKKTSALKKEAFAF